MTETATPASHPSPASAVPDVSPPAPAPIEPLMGIESFAQMGGLRPHMVVALTHWMAHVAHHDPAHYYTHRAWHDFLAAARQHPVSEGARA